MKENLNNIQIIFTENDAGIAVDVLDFLRQKTGNTHLPVDAAVIIVSDEATADQEWQKEVRALNPAVRLVPIGGIVNADYNDPDVIPTRIEELNFIRIDEDLHQNLWESLTIDQDFYDVRNTILVNMNSWLISEKSESFLMADYSQVRKSLAKVEQKLRSESDERFKSQLEDMKEYLSLSRIYARKIFHNTLRQRLGISALAVVFGLAVFFGIRIVRDLQRAARESALLGRTPTDAEAAEYFVLLCDGINNLYIDGVTRGFFFNEMTSYLDMNWATSPTGLNYKYRLYDPRLMGDERYLSVMSEQRNTVIFDTWTGKIKDTLMAANDDLKASYTDTGNNVVIVVTGDNRILFGDPESHQWLTNNTQYPFTGNSDIRIRTGNGYATVFDDQNQFLFDLNGYRPVSYVTPKTMGTEDYVIHDVRMYDNESVSAVEYEGDMSFYYSPFDSPSTPGWHMGVKPKQDVLASVLQNTMVFAAEDGNIMVFNRAKTEFHTIGLKLPDVRFLQLLNDEILVYSDAKAGTHVYDITQQADLGTVLSGFEDIEYLGTGKHTVFCYAEGAYHCQDITDMLPKKEIDESIVLKRFSGTSPQDEGYLYNISCQDGMMRFDMDVYETREPVRKTFYLDGSHIQEAGSAVSDPVAAPKGTSYYFKEPLSYSGEITVIGVIDNGFGFVVGTSDGRFREFALDYSGSWYADSYLQIPTRSAVTEIIEAEDCYYLKDEAGYYWHADKRYPSHSGNSRTALDKINKKLKIHGYFPKELLDSIDPQTVEDMNLQVLNGSDGKEWE